jgi:hypothetical protein
MNRIRIRLPLILFSYAILLRLSAAAEVPVKWLDPAPPAMPQGVSWGVPWTKGMVQKNQAFSLKTADGQALPLQTWPLAYWQDGSIKWTGFATVAGPDTGKTLTLETIEREVTQGPTDHLP